MPDHDDSIVIKRYDGTRLYDVSAALYLSPAVVAALVRDGTKVRIHDAVSGADITAAVLMEIGADER